MLGARCSRSVGFVAALAAFGCQTRGSAIAPEAAGAGPAANPGPSVVAPAGTGVPVAVLELFTSEGCSSCPAADENLARLTEEADKVGPRVFTLELHVDYWNHLGWADPFSDARYSLRQGAYAKQLGAQGVYTPQLLVNGREELVGSDSARSRAAIARALQTPASAAVSFTARRHDAAIDVEYRVSATQAVDLNVAFADDAAQTHVPRGENADRLLLHRHVVRAFRSVRVGGAATGRVSVPWRTAGTSTPVFVAAFASDPGTLAVLGADARLLPAE